jgi:hypothetical protein
MVNGNFIPFVVISMQGKKQKEINMFNFGKKQDDDPKKALEKADNVLNKGLMGAMTKGFMGQDFVDKMNNTLDQGKAALNMTEQGQWVVQNGLEAMAEVLGVQDTGTTINNNPVVVMQLKVSTSMGTHFDTSAQAMVSRIAVPRTGDKIKIKYNPADPTQIAVL